MLGVLVELFLNHNSTGGSIRVIFFCPVFPKMEKNQFPKHSSLNELRQWTKLKITVLSCQFVSTCFMFVIKAIGRWKKICSLLMGF